ncbi:sulfotransferase [Neptunicoccus cionae]|uniref:Sulfotransferase n=1 Tax=Neptunicoccus cionae TaxID=2035344 RepID=A0A916QYV2_9RHOB|nr:sulfotransferase [Amylibacter cionae]GGA22256.1 hypothetical protein GCM10011498_23770 [Amylibacter cionae]
MAEKLAILKGRTFFLGVGAQKAGTTWLSFYLRDHPEVYFSPIKEMHFWGTRTRDDKWPISMFRKKLKAREAELQANPDLPAKGAVALRDRIRMGRDIGAYRRFFRRRVKNEQVFGEITPAYCALDRDELELIRREYPSTKIIFLLRNPADRLWSQMRFSEKFETLEQLEAKIDGVFERPLYRERYDYVTAMRNLRAVFPAENLHFDFYENLFTQDAIDRLCHFLGITPLPGEFERSRNVSVKMPLGPEQRRKMIHELSHQYTYMRDLYAGALPTSWLADLEILETAPDIASER